LSDEATDALRKDAPRLAKVLETGEGSQDLIDKSVSALEKLQNSGKYKSKAMKLSSDAMEIVDKQNANFNPNDLSSIFAQEINRIDTLGAKSSPTAIQAKSALSKFIDEIGELAPKTETKVSPILDASGRQISETITTEAEPISGRKIKQLIRNLDNTINKYDPNYFGNTEANDQAVNALRRSRAQLNNLMKDSIENASDRLEFENLMKDSRNTFALDSRLAKLASSKQASKITGKQNAADQELIEKNLKSFLRRGAKEKTGIELSQKLSPDLGLNLADELEKIKFTKLMESRANQGSNMVNAMQYAAGGLGLATGTALGSQTDIPGVQGILGGLGALAGGLYGKRLETQGRRKLANYFVKQADQVSPEKTLNKVQGTKYQDILNSALQRGGSRSFAVTNYLLQSQDENYRNKTIEQE
jgi:hypothetical protein